MAALQRAHLVNRAMSHLIPAAIDRPSDDPIFALNAEANRRASTGEEVINATLGALMADDGSLALIGEVQEAIRSIDPARAAAYAPIAGASDFLGAVIRDTFGEGTMADRTVAVATPGGTGAIHHAIANYLEPGQALLTSSYYWSPYRIIAHHIGRQVETFRMYGDDERFDLESLEQSVDQMIEAQGRVLVVLNFPCHNPTGYSLDAGEWRAVAEMLSRAAARAPVTLLLDVAYSHYGLEEGWMENLAGFVEEGTLLVAWTASKAFTQYGARVGALLATVADDDARQRTANALSYSCRGTWSNCNHLGMLAITELLVDPERRVRVDEQRAELRALLDDRVQIFNQHAAEAGLRTPRYEGGFFVAVFTPDARATAAAAKEEGVFVVPLNGAVRVALCSTPSRDVPRLVEVLSRAVRATEAEMEQG